VAYAGVSFGGTSHGARANVELPWARTFEVSGLLTLVSVSANDASSGHLHCGIWVDGVGRTQSTAAAGRSVTCVRVVAGT
jgi:hypothetical protein